MAKKKVDAVLDPEVLPPVAEAAPVSAEEALILGSRENIDTFMEAVGPFFSRAMDLEKSAETALAAARAVPPSKTPEQDAARQLAIRTLTQSAKAIESHWEGPCSAFHGIHKTLTAARARATSMLTSAKALHQSDVNRFDAEARAAARKEQERLDREAEQRAREERAAEEAKLRAAEEAAEASSPTLSEREAQFVIAFVEWGLTWSDPRVNNAIKAAGYKDTSNAWQRLSASKKVLTAIDSAQTAAALRKQRMAVTAAPLDIRPTQAATVAVNQVTSAVVIKRVTVEDAELFMRAMASGTHRIPGSCGVPSQSGLNEQANLIGDKVNQWPGVRYVEDRKNR